MSELAPVMEPASEPEVFFPESVAEVELPDEEPKPSTLAPAAQTSPEEKSSDRRIDVDAKQTVVAGLLAKAGCEGLLILDQANLAWLTSGAVARHVLDPDDLPALYFNPAQRWLLASNVESQRMFDQEMDSLGFLLKEWPWHWSREQLIKDVCQGRAVASDLPFGSCKVIGEELSHLRRVMTPYEQACYRLLGQGLAHALQATCRGARPGDSERELAGQIGHRLFHRGALPISVSVAADGRSRTYRRHGFTSATIENYAVLTATAKKYGLHVTASRSFSFGPTQEKYRIEHVNAAKVAATYIASTWPDAMPEALFAAGKRVYLLTGYEHEWQLCPQGFVTGRVPVEAKIHPDAQDVLKPGWAVTWEPTIGAAACIDTFLVSERGPERLTPLDQWPLIGIRIAGIEFTCPSILEK